jgi:hypothetical protein
MTIYDNYYINNEEFKKDNILNLSNYKIYVGEKEYPVEFYFNWDDDYITSGFDNIKVLKTRIESILKNKVWNDKALYKNLFEVYQFMWKDINSNQEHLHEKDRISKPEDILKSLQPPFTIQLYTDKYYGIEFFALLGKCWWDDEHGFSITFPNDKFVKIENSNECVKLNSPIKSFLSAYDRYMIDIYN